jgi:hypothetical protein
LRAAIKEAGCRPMLLESLDEIEAEEARLLLQRHQLRRRLQPNFKLPESPSVLGQMLEEQFRKLAVDSPGFAKLMRILVPNVYVYSVRLCDGGHLLPRAKVTLNLGGTFPDISIVPGLAALFTRELTLDLFTPPQRVRILAESIRLAAEGLGPNAIAKALPEKPSSTAVQNALALHRKMLSLGLATPYVNVLEPPEDYTKLRRQKNAHYKFTPLDGYQRPAL